MNFLLKKQVETGRKLSQLFWIILPLVFLSFVLQACDENKFPVSPVPDQFEFIPPNDVNMLTAIGSDRQVTLKWDAALENTLKAVHVINQNTGEEKVLAGTASEIVFTGLTNYTKYTFGVRTESLEEQLSYGVTISAKPFVLDNVKPGAVTNLIGYKLGENTAFAVWESPEDIDVEGYILTLGNESVTIDGETTSGSINGDISQPLKVYAVDYSANQSEAAETIADAPVVTIDGFDDGTTETVQIHKVPIIKAIDGYVVTYFDQEYRSDVSPLPDTYAQTMPVSNGKPLWANPEKTVGTWLEPVKVTLLSAGKEVSTYEYLTYNNIPGTLMLTHAKFLNGEPNDVRRNNDGDSFMSVLGNFGGMPYPDGVYGLYDINVLEDGDYEVDMHFSNEAGRKFSLSVDGGPMVEGLTGPDRSANWDTYIPASPIVISLTKGQHELRVNLTSGGCNYRKLVFKKK